MDEQTWEQRIGTYWEQEFDDTRPEESRARMRDLVAVRPDGDAAALFEYAGVHDALGLEHEAIPLYRAAIRAGLEGERATRVFIQLASTLRNVGASAEAVRMLESMPVTEADEAARQAFLALALYDEGRYGDALRTALAALIPTLDGYRRALGAYADELPSTTSDSVASPQPVGHRRE